MSPYKQIEAKEAARSLAEQSGKDEQELFVKQEGFSQEPLSSPNDVSILEVISGGAPPAGLENADMARFLRNIQSRESPLKQPTVKSSAHLAPSAGSLPGQLPEKKTKKLILSRTV